MAAGNKRNFMVFSSALTRAMMDGQ